MSQQRSSWLRRWTRRVAKVVGVLFVVTFWVGFLIYIPWEFVNHQQFARNHESTLGTVTNYKFHCGGHQCHSRTTISFVTTTGRPMQFDVYDHGEKAIGESVTVYYNPDHPDYAQLTEGWSDFEIRLIVTVIMFLLIAAGRLIWTRLYAMFATRPPKSA